MIATITAPLLLLVISLCAAMAGRQLLTRLRLMGPDTPGRTVLDLAMGYAILGSLLAVLGLLGLLKVPWVIALVALLAAIGFGEPTGLIADLRRALARLQSALAGPEGTWMLKGGLLTFGCLLFTVALLAAGSAGLPLVLATAATLLGLAGLAVWRPALGIAWLLVLWAIAGLLGSIAPPADSDWDGLAEHLAQAKIYAASGRYQPLWYDHHSHFPALPQMLFTLGMLLQGVSLAKLFHWAFGIVTMASAFVLSERFVARGSGKWAALVAASTPLVGWLMQVGYVDLSTCAYALLMMLSFLDWRERGGGRRLALCGLMAGAMMATKMQGIALFGVLVFAVAIVLVRRSEGIGRMARGLCVFGLAAAVLAAPWYVKSWVLTGNPVYPFAYSVFGGKYWGPNEARDYEHHQKGFGVGDIPPAAEFEKLPPLQRLFYGPRTPAHLLMAPWNLTLNPVPFTVQKAQGSKALLPILLTDWIGPLYLLGLLALLVVWLRGRPWERRHPRLLDDAAANPVPPRGAGFPARQAVPAASPAPAQGLLPPAIPLLLWVFLPLWVWWLASMQLTRYVVPSLLLLAPVVGYVAWRIAGTAARALPVLWLAATVGAALYLAGAPTLVATGIVPQDAYLRMACQVYEPSRVLNRLVPPDGMVITYGEPRGFYLDCPYMWGDQGHHRIIPYDDLKTPDQLVKHLRSMGITHALINQAMTGPLKPELGGPLGLLAEALGAGKVKPVVDDELKRPEYLVLDLREENG